MWEVVVGLGRYRGWVGNVVDKDGKGVLGIVVC